MATQDEVELVLRQLHSETEVAKRHASNKAVGADGGARVAGVGARRGFMASLSLRIRLDCGRRIGPGKINLLEEIERCGSISGAGRGLAMSYRRAWDLVEEMNAMFAEPLVARQIGGRKGGGASLTPAGLALVAHYRAIERAATDSARERLDLLQSAAAPAG